MQIQDERWMKLCEQAAVEQDPERLLEIVKEINNLLEAKLQRDGQKPSSQDLERTVS